LLHAGILLSDCSQGGVAFRNVHLTVEFMPSFANTPMQEAWSWDNNPVNITCLAESIPNATISWRINSLEINERYNDINIRKFGEGPLSSLQVSQININDVIVIFLRKYDMRTWIGLI
jgi:neurocan core protein